MNNTLVLDIAYQPLRVVPWDDALDQVIRGAAEIMTQYQEDVYTNQHDLTSYDVSRYGPLGKWFDEELVNSSTVKVTFRKPAVIRLFSSKDRIRQVRFSRQNVFLRDDYQCQYVDCKTTAQWMKTHGTKKLPAHMLTFDHVLPRSRGGKTIWTNIITSCQDCNCKKDDQTPSEANMTLLKQPDFPNKLPIVHSKIRTPSEWRDFVYFNVELEE